MLLKKSSGTLIKKETEIIITKLKVMENEIAIPTKTKPRRIYKVQAYGMFEDSIHEKISVALRYISERYGDLKYEVERLLPHNFDLLAAKFKKDPKFADTEMRYHKRLPSPILIVNDKEYMRTPAEFFDRLLAQYDYIDRTPLPLYKRLSVIKLERYLRSTGRKYAFIDFFVKHPKHPTPYRVIFELYNDLLPKTVQNFADILEGKHKNSSGKTLTYRGSKIHRIQPNGFIQGGDIEGKGGSGGESIYGECFEDEGYAVPHDRPGIIGMANKGTRHSNNSQFYITLCKLDSFNKNCVAFGSVIAGFRVVKLINSIPVDNGKPLVDVEIKDCGLYKLEIPKYRKLA